MKHKTSSISHILNKLEAHGILDAIGDGVSIQDTAFRVLYQNKSHKNFMGDHIGEYCYKSFANNSDTCEGCPLIMVFKDGTVHTAVRNTPTNNGMRFFEITASPLRSASGKIVAGIEIVRDVTAHKLKGEEIKKNEKFLNDIFDSIQDGISILDKDMTIIRVNHAIERWYSHAMPLIGKKCYDAYHSRKECCEVCPTSRTIENCRVAYNVVPKRGPRGEVVGWLDLYSFPLVDMETNELKGIIEYVRDITDRKLVEEELKKRVEELEKFYEIAVGRELKMKGLKDEIQKLKDELSKYKK
ncbi:MAG: PAS domain-containing protein [Nitrospirae bacterium]|nr:PAS domain-containing protein [Nitrospirota bacterium]